MTYIKRTGKLIPSDRAGKKTLFMGDSSDLHTIAMLYETKECELKVLKALQGKLCR